MFKKSNSNDIDSFTGSAFEKVLLRETCVVKNFLCASIRRISEGAGDEICHS